MNKLSPTTAAIRADHKLIARSVSSILAADAPDAHHKGELGTMTRALSLAGISTGAVAKHVKSIAVALMGDSMSGAECASIVAPALVAWRRAVQAEIDETFDDKKLAKAEKNRVIEAAGYAIRVLQKQCGVRMVWNEATASYDVTTSEAKPKNKPLSADGKQAATNASVELNEKIQGAARADKSELAEFTPAELLAALAKHYPSRAAMVQAVENMDRGHWPAVIGSEGERAKADRAVLGRGDKPALDDNGDPIPAKKPASKKPAVKVASNKARKPATARKVADVTPALVAALQEKFGTVPAAVGA